MSSSQIHVAAPTTFNDLSLISPPVSPPGSPSLMFTLPSESANGFYSFWEHYPEIATPTGSGSLSPPMSRQSSILSIRESFRRRSSLSGSIQGPTSDRQNSDRESDSRPTSMTNSVSYAYTVKSVNSRKSRLMVLYPRRVRSQRLSGVESILESGDTSLESLVALSSRPSMSMSLHENLTPVTDTEHIVDVMETLSVLFRSSPESSSPVERRLSACWKSLLRIKVYEEKHGTPNLRATRIFADTLLCAHNEIVERDFVGSQELTHPCEKLNEAFEDAYILLANSGMIPQVPEHISALDTDHFKNFVVMIKQLINLIGALEVLVDSLAILAAVEASNVTPKADGDPEDDVILNVPGWRQRNESQPTLSSTPAPGAIPEEAASVDNTLRLLLVTRNEELERELRGLRFLLWRASPRAKIKLGSVVKLTLPLHHEELMRSPVEEFVAHWQEAVEPHGQEIDDRITESNDTDSW